jgi:CheY-like chemotaxis protein
MTKILLIEDNPANASIYTTILQNQGHAEVVQSNSGIEGLWVARNGAFDAILIDFDLPDIHGTQVGLALYHLMRNGQVKPAPLVALTAQSDKATRDEAERLGFAAFIGKPCLDVDLLDTVRQVITHSDRQPI